MKSTIRRGIKLKSIFKRAIVICSILILSLSFVGCNFISNNPDRGGYNPLGPYENSAELISQVEIKEIADEDRVLLSKADVYEKYSQAVVTIKTDVGTGSGVIVDIDSTNYNETVNDMYIVTCHHVIEGATEAEVYVPDSKGRNYSDEGYESTKYVFYGELGGDVSLSSPVRLIGGDKYSDLAVLGLYVADNDIASEISRSKAKVMSKNHKLRVGDDVVAIGNPMGVLPGSILDGIVSYINRPAAFSGIGTLSLIQTTVGITGGNSGGGLFNLYGELVGITNGGKVETVLDYNEKGELVQETISTNYNFAIPLYVSESEMKQGIVPIVSQLIATSTSTNYGYVTGRWMLGVTVSQTQDTFTEEYYVSVSGVENYSPASLGGIKEGDIILSVSYSNKKANISTLTDFDTALSEIRSTLGLGDNITIKVQRGSSEVNCQITLAQYIYMNTGK